MYVTMSKVLIVVMAFLGCAVLCSSRPGFNQELQANEETIENFTIMKERDKRTANHPPDKSKIYNPVDQSVDQPLEHLSKDSGFVKNLEFVFGSGRTKPKGNSEGTMKQNIAPASYVFEMNMDNFTHENNTGLEDRLRSQKQIQDLYNGFVTSQSSTATANNGLLTGSKDEQDNQMLQVFGHPSYNVENATKTPPQLITQAKKQLTENIQDSDNNSTLESTSEKKHEDGGKGGSNTKITFIYMYFICSFFVLICS